MQSMLVWLIICKYLPIVFVQVFDWSRWMGGWMVFQHQISFNTSNIKKKNPLKICSRNMMMNKIRYLHLNMYIYNQFLYLNLSELDLLNIFASIFHYYHYYSFPSFFSNTWLYYHHQYSLFICQWPFFLGHGWNQRIKMSLFNSFLLLKIKSFHK